MYSGVVAEMCRYTVIALIFRFKVYKVGPDVISSLAMVALSSWPPAFLPSHIYRRTNSQSFVLPYY